MFETEQDRINQRAVMGVIMKTLEATAFVGGMFRHEEIPSIEGDSAADFKVFLWDRLAGIVEIKCRSKDYDSFFFQKNGYMIARHKLAMLYKSHRDGVPGMLAFRTSNGHVYAAMIEYLVEYRELWKTADPDKMKTTDHSTRVRLTDDPGYILPLNLFSRIA